MFNHKWNVNGDSNSWSICLPAIIVLLPIKFTSRKWLIVSCRFNYVFKIPLLYITKLIRDRNYELWAHLRKKLLFSFFTQWLMYLLFIEVLRVHWIDLQTYCPMTNLSMQNQSMFQFLFSEENQNSLTVESKIRFGRALTCDMVIRSHEFV